MTESPPPPDPADPEQATAPGAPAGPGMPYQPGIPGMPGAPGAPGRFRPRLRHTADPWQLWMHRAEQIAVDRAEHMPVPAWLRKTPGERRWPVTLTVVVAITLQVLLPPHLTEPLPRTLLPALEGALGVGLTIANPVRIERGGRAIRVASIVLILLMTIANAASAVLLDPADRGRQGRPPRHAAAGQRGLDLGDQRHRVRAVVLGVRPGRPGEPRARHHAAPGPDVPADGSARTGAARLGAQFVDYLYLSFTNATAFSPTDVMPLARWAKLTMPVQSAVSLAVGALVIARAVNILPS